MALSFPPSPVNQQTYTDDNGSVWVFDGVKWNVARGTLNKLFNGAKIKLGSQFNLVPSAQAITFTEEVIDTNNFFNPAAPTRITINENGYFRLNVTIFTSTNGGLFTIVLKKNGSTNLFTANLNPNQSGNYDETVQLNTGDYLEIYTSENLSIGNLTEDCTFEITRIGLVAASQITSLESFSGVRTILTTSFATINTPTAVVWDSTEFDVNSDPLGTPYWNVSASSRLTVRTSGYYRVKASIETSSSDTYSLALKKNNSNVLTSANIGPSSLARIDEIFNFTANDFIELHVNDSLSSGSLTDETFLEIVRLGV